MTSLERRYDGRYRIVFCHRGKRFNHSLGKVSEREARSCKDRLEENLRFLERGLLELPEDVELGVFLVTGGKLCQKPVLERQLSLGELFDHYRKNYPQEAKEPNTRYTEEIHMDHLTRIVGGETLVRGITLSTMQRYVEGRSQDTGRHGMPVSHTTVKKEIGTFASIWNKWALPQGFVGCPSPTRGLVYHKARGKPPFQTWEQIEWQIARGGLARTQEKELWTSLFLTLPEVEELLGFSRTNARHRFVYVMFCFAAHTGARRSEMLRSRIDDFDFAQDTVTIREKKRDRSKELTFRTVPMSPFLRQVMMEWFADHPRGQFTISSEPNKPPSVQLAAHHFRWTVDGSKWANLIGWHVLRHSFASNCAAKGIDQRVIDRWLGHQTEEMRKRYQHLFPDQQKLAILSVFGKAG